MAAPGPDADPAPLIFGDPHTRVLRRFGQNMENTALCRMSQPGGKATSTSSKKKPKKGSTAGAVRVEVSSVVTLTESDEQDIRSQVEASAGVGADAAAWSCVGGIGG